MLVGGADNSDIPLERRSHLFTEYVRVPSSEHVAEIVGRQGCKIKSLRTKTNTYIKTPERGEEPVFVVRGMAEEVLAAKQEILSTADHFTKIRANRRNNGTATNGRPEDVTIKVPVMMHLVGLLVGAKGTTIKNIQQKTDTYIITPTRGKKPVFEVKGLPRNVSKAQELMYDHIRERTGISMDNPLIQKSLRVNFENPYLFGQTPCLNILAQNLQNDLMPNGNFEWSGYETDEGIGGSPVCDNISTPESISNIWSPSDENTLSKIVAPNSLKLKNSSMTSRSMHGINMGFSDLSGYPQSYDTSSSHDLSPMSFDMSELSSVVSSVVSSPVFGHGPAILLQLKQCLVCEKENTTHALLVPCGHSMFCYDCACRTLCKSPEGERMCPVCHSQVDQVLQM